MFKILFEDDYLMVIDKPPGQVVDPSDTQNTGTLAQILIEDYKINLERGGIVHRLDKDTSGVIVVAKTLEALENLQAQFKDRIVKKEYLSLVHGFLENKVKVDGAILRNPSDREKFIVLDQNLINRGYKETAKEATTEFIPVQKYIIKEEKLDSIFEGFNKIQFRKLSASNYECYTLVRCFPKTGRTHQLRVHLKHLGFPIVGDSKYGGRKTTRLDHRWCKRQFLHAEKIKFLHPVLQKEMEFKSPIPDDLENVLKNLQTV